MKSPFLYEGVRRELSLGGYKGDTWAYLSQVKIAAIGKYKNQIPKCPS